MCSVSKCSIFCLNAGTRNNSLLLSSPRNERVTKKKNITYWSNSCMWDSLLSLYQNKLRGSIVNEREVKALEQSTFQTPKNFENNNIMKGSWCNHELIDNMGCIGDVWSSNIMVD